MQHFYQRYVVAMLGYYPTICSILGVIGILYVYRYILDVIIIGTMKCVYQLRSYTAGMYGDPTNMGEHGYPMVEKYITGI